jgi:hypothetical protein
MNYDINIGDAVFLRDGASSVGSVHRAWSSDNTTIVIYVENAGDFDVLSSAIKSAQFGKVVLDEEKLDEKMRASIRHAHNAETRP